jgi:hypothetical protein
LQECDFLILRQPDVQVLDAQGMEHDPCDAAPFKFHDKQEEQIVALDRIDRWL